MKRAGGVLMAKSSRFDGLTLHDRDMASGKIMPVESNRYFES